ncbi:MAG TPA: ComF family protein [Candidatus Dormibacteraeota bacterium]
MSAIAVLGRLLLEAVAPLRCAACDTVAGAPICPACDAELGALPVPRAVDLDDLRAWSAFVFAGPVREVLHRGKFQGNRAALRQIAGVAAIRLELAIRPPPDAVLPVPLGARRRRQRGYNQAEVVAAEIAQAVGAHVLDGLTRVRETEPQSSRGEADRRTNVAGAFGWRGADLAGARLWLIDDVLTTGATMEAAAAVLLQAGARRVDGLVIARVP